MKIIVFTALLLAASPLLAQDTPARPAPPKSSFSVGCVILPPRTDLTPLNQDLPDRKKIHTCRFTRHQACQVYAEQVLMPPALDPKDPIMLIEAPNTGAADRGEVFKWVRQNSKRRYEFTCTPMVHGKTDHGSVFVAIEEER